MDAARAPALLARVAELSGGARTQRRRQGGLANRFRCRIRDTKYSMILRPPRPILTLSHLRQDHTAFGQGLPPAHPFQVASATTSSLGRAPSNSLNKACRKRDIVLHGEHPSPSRARPPAAPSPPPARRALAFARPPAAPAPAPARRARATRRRCTLAPAQAGSAWGADSQLLMILHILGCQTAA
jgi:hypothetical protein